MAQISENERKSLLERERKNKKNSKRERKKK